MDHLAGEGASSWDQHDARDHQDQVVGHWDVCVARVGHGEGDPGVWDQGDHVLPRGQVWDHVPCLG